MDDLRIVATRLWDLLGHKPSPPKEFVEALYAQLRWFRPSEAEQLVGAMQTERLLLPGPTPGTLVGAPELDAVAVPITYRPPADLRPSARSASARDLLTRVLEEVRASTGEDAGRLREETGKVAVDLGVLPAAAALLVASRRGLSLPALRERFGRELRHETVPD